MANIGDALGAAFYGAAELANTYRQADAPRVQYEATKVQNQIQMNMHEFQKQAMAMRSSDIGEAWKTQQEQLSDLIQSQPQEVQYVLQNWWENQSTQLKIGVDNLYQQKWRGEETSALVERIDYLSTLGTDEAMSGIRQNVETALSAGIIDDATAYKISQDAIGQVHYNAARGKAFQIMEEGGLDAALEFARTGDAKLTPQKRSALRSEIEMLYADRQNQKIRLDKKAHDDASSIAERIIDGELSLQKMDYLIETDNRMTGGTRLYWRNWMMAQEDAARQEDYHKQTIEDEQYRKQELNNILEDWEFNGPRADQTDRLRALHAQGLITKNEYDDYRGTVDGDPITDPEFNDALKLIKAQFESDKEGMEEALSLFRKKIYRDRYIDGNLNPNRLQGQDLVRTARNIAAERVLLEMYDIKKDQFAIGGTGFVGAEEALRLNDVEKAILAAQNGEFIGITEENAKAFNQIATHQETLFTQLVGEPSQVRFHKNGLPIFEFNGRQFMFHIPTDTDGKPTQKDEEIIVHLGGDEWAKYDWRAIKEDRNIKNEAAQTADPTIAAYERQKEAQEREASQEVQSGGKVPKIEVNPELSPVERAMDELRQQLNAGGEGVGILWNRTARRRIKEIAEKFGISEQLAKNHAIAVGLVDEDFKIYPFGDY